MLARVGLHGIDQAADGAVDGISRELARRITAVAPQLDGDAIAVIDSPRWPLDHDWSQVGLVGRSDQVTGRVIDTELQGLVKTLRLAGASSLKLSMFPTPRLSYFTAQIAGPSCKRHLRAFGRELFGLEHSASGPSAGGTFTRFMLAGFATYRALATRRVTCYEGYPDLQFRLWNGDEPLPSKMKRKMTKVDRTAAREVRCRLVVELAARLGVEGSAAVGTLDQADAAILALSVLAARSADCGLVMEYPAEGRFWVTLPGSAACLIERCDDKRLAQKTEA